MIRVIRGYIARRRRKKTRSFVSTTQQKMRALNSTHRDRGRRKRDFRRLWITRINAVTRANGASYSYRRLIHDLYKRQVLLNRKILARMAISKTNCLYMISNEIVK
uniref:ribosomal protein L20 n=1 Tax=Stelechocarpus burahol TaxID=235837 RepID=UPI0022FD9667|nr:ribosomal protein L20 [Stelechocarpus burahol]WBG68730.1 ribosomal protein L20 [Stelechocarpus burahol]